MSDIWKKSYEKLIVVGTWFQSPILLLCRLYYGWNFMDGGLSKFRDIKTFIGFLHTSDFFAPKLGAYLAAGTELIGGLFLLIGLASRLVSIPLIITMIMAYHLAHDGGFVALWTDPSTFVAQHPFAFLLTSLLVFAFGPGIFSIDALLKRYMK